mmetsp:Transcript_80427/g.139594  ORF Transcript_80427/g.139594 Transcript_80427/m.139594 type:complete len:509 (+) Transcript_80427:88-1614(+)
MDEHPAFAKMKRSMSSREMLQRAGKEVAKSVIVAKAAEVGARRLGLGAAASTAAAGAWFAGLAIARRVHPQYLDPVSANQINRDPEYVCNCHMVIPTHDKVEVERMFKVFEFYVEKFARFRERVVVRKLLWPYWEPVAKVDINQHVFADSTPMTHEKMHEYLSRSCTQGMNPLIPLWKAVAFTDYTFDDGTTGSAILLKWHHCMGDGFSMAQTLITGTDFQTETAPKKAPSLAERVHQPGQFGKVLSATAKLVAMQDDSPSALKAKNLLKPLDDRVACWITSRVPISEIKRVGKAKGYTINDMVLAALAGTMRNYQMKKQQKIVDPLAVVWVALRPISEAFTPKDISEIDEPGNKTLGCVYVRLPVTQEFPRREDRVRAIVDEISKLKGSPEPILTQMLTGAFGLMPRTLSNPIWDALSNKVSMSVSNVPGPPMDFTWAGIRPEGLYVWVPPVGTISTFSVITSMKDRITLSLALDGSLFDKEDADFIRTDFDNELSLLTASMQPSRL